MVKFGLAVVQALAIVATLFILIGGVVLTFRAGRFRAKWALLSDIIPDPTFIRTVDFAFGYGIVLALIAVLGLFAVCLGGYGLLILYNTLIIISAIIMVIYAAVIINETIQETGLKISKIKEKINDMTRVQLENVQSEFKCCGIEKYTDYMNFWNLWNKKVFGPYERNAKILNTTTTLKARVKRERFRLRERKTTVKPWYMDQYHLLPRVKKPMPPSIFTGLQSIKHGTIKRRNEVTGKHKESSTTSKRPHQNEKTSKDYKKDLIVKKISIEPPLEAQSWSLHTPWISNSSNSSNPLPRQRSPDLHEKALDTIEKFVGNVHQPYDDLLKSLGEIHYNVYRAAIPNTILYWMSLLYEIIANWIDWILNPARSVLRWWLGSGWDRFLFFGLRTTLPLSCCKNPATPCIGNPEDTYLQGCRSKVTSYWTLINHEIAIFYLCYSALMTLTSFILFILTAGIGEKYYGPFPC